MKLSKYAIGFLSLFTASTSAGYILLGKTDPNTASLWITGAVYGVILIFVFSLVALVSALFQNTRSATRRGLLLGLLCVSALGLSASGLLSLWTAILLLTTFTLIEIYAVSQ